MKEDEPQIMENNGFGKDKKLERSQKAG